jgi:hypothetical protein
LKHPWFKSTQQQQQQQQQPSLVVATAGPDNSSTIGHASNTSIVSTNCFVLPTQESVKVDTSHFEQEKEDYSHLPPLSSIPSSSSTSSSSSSTSSTSTDPTSHQIQVVVAEEEVTEEPLKQPAQISSSQGFKRKLVVPAIIPSVTRRRSSRIKE